MSEKYQSSHTGTQVDEAVEAITQIISGEISVPKATADSSNRPITTTYANYLVVTQADNGRVTLVLRGPRPSVGVEGQTLSTISFDFTDSTSWSTIRTQVTNLINGTLAAGVATKAIQDESGNNLKASYGASLQASTDTNLGSFTVQVVNKNGETIGNPVSFEIGNTNF